MATIVNNPGGPNDDGAGVGMVVGIIIAVIVVALVLIYGIPAIRNSYSNPGAPSTGGSNANINLSLPGTGSNGSGSMGGNSTGGSNNNGY